MYRQLATEQLDRVEFDAARLGFFQLLRRKRMSPQFVERHAEDLFAQACLEYSRQLEEGKKIGRPAAWIVTCAWHRTVGLLETRDWRPQMVSTERLSELGVDEGTPEQDFLGEDRQRKVRDAVERLPEYQRRLLALSYFEEQSIREAARHLKWTPSKAQRAHEAAQRRLHKLLGVETSDELGVEIGLVAFLSLAGGGSARHLRVLGGIEAVLDAATHPVHASQRALDVVLEPFSRGGDPDEARPIAGLGRRAAEGLAHPGALLDRSGQRASELGRRLILSGGAEGTAAAAEGGGRALELCKAVAAVCVIGGGTVTGVLLVEGHHQAARPAAHHRTAAITKPAPRTHRPSTADLLAEGHASEPEPAAQEPEASASTETGTHPAQRHHPTEHHHKGHSVAKKEPTVEKAEPPPTRPEGEFEPSPEPTTQAEPVTEPSTAVTDAATTSNNSSSSSSAGESSAKPKAVPANSPGEFEP